MSEQLGNFIAFEPTELPTSAFALAALGTETLGFFHLDGQRLQVVKRQMQPGDRWCHARLLHELNSRRRQILGHAHHRRSLSQSFHQWEPDAPVLSGDILVYIETAKQFFFHPNQQPANPFRQPRQPAWQEIFPRLWDNLKQLASRFGQLSFQQQVRRVAIVCGIVVLVLLDIHS